MKKNDLSEYRYVRGHELCRIFTKRDAEESGFLSVGATYTFYNEVVWIDRIGNKYYENRWQAALLIGPNEEAIPMSPRILCGLGYVDNILTRVNKHSIKGDLIKLIITQAKIKCVGHIECLVDEYSENLSPKQKIKIHYPLLEIV